MSARQYLITFAAFAVLAFPVLHFLHFTLLPLPLYDSQKVGGAIPEFVRGETIVMEFEAPDSIYCVDLRDALFQPGQEIRAHLYPAWAKPGVGEGSTLRHGNPDLPFPRHCVKPANDAGDRMCLELQWLKDPGPAKVTEFLFPKGLTPIPVPIPGGVLQFQPDGKDSIFEMDFAAPEANLSAIDLTGLVTARSTRLRLEIVNLDTKITLLRDNVAWNDGVKNFSAVRNAKGDRLRLQLKWKTIRPPKLQVAEGNPNFPLQVTANGRPIPHRPFVMLDYTWLGPILNLLWIPAFAMTGLAFWRAELIPAALIALGLSATATSVNAWQQLYGTYSAHFDPDHFAKVGGLMANWLRGGDTGEAAEFIATWRYQWLPFVPMCLAVLNWLGLELSFAYLLMAALPCFGAMLVFHGILRQSFKLEPRWAFLGALLFICHHFMLKSFSKPSTDAMGLLFILSTFYLILRRLEHKEGWSDFAIAGLLLLHLFTRPTGTLFAPFACGMAVLADWRREGRMDLPGVLPTALRMALAPAAIFLGAFLLLHWGDSLKYASETYSRSFATPRLFVIKILSCLQWLPLLWIPIWPRMRKDPMIWFLGFWVLYYIFILVLVRPAYVSRIFLPIHFVAIVPAVLGLRELWTRQVSWRWPLAGAVAVFVAVNLGVVLWQSGQLYSPPEALAEWISH